jgi:CHAD domain-containing protein
MSHGTDSGPVSLAPVLQKLAEHMEQASAGDDAHAIHQVRVATRRLDVWLRMGRQRMLRDDLRWLRGVAGCVRDLDVLLAADPPAPFSAWLEARRETAREQLRDALACPRAHGLLLALSVLPPLTRRRAAKGVARLVRQALRAGRAFEAAGTLPDLHRLRRALRRARYAVEWTEGDARRLQSAQDALGLTNDAVVALRLLSLWGKDEELPEYRDDLVRRIDDGREHARALWVPLRDHLLE